MEIKNRVIQKEPAVSHTLPPAAEQTSPDLYRRTKNPFTMINNAATPKSHSLCRESGTSQGKTEMKALTEVPPATMASAAGITQQKSVLEEPRKARKLTIFFMML
jgi:hypothetical protein